MGRQAIDMTGRKVGKLTVLGRADLSGSNARWFCECDCGGTATVQGGHLRNGRTLSCGCLRYEQEGRGWSPDDQIGYKAAHTRVRTLKGSPQNHRCVDCSGRAHDWSLRHDAPLTFEGDNGRGTVCRFSPNPLDYEARCRTCHRNYDRP